MRQYAKCRGMTMNRNRYDNDELWMSQEDTNKKKRVNNYNKMKKKQSRGREGQRNRCWRPQDNSNYGMQIRKNKTFGHMAMKATNKSAQRLPIFHNSNLTN